MNKPIRILPSPVSRAAAVLLLLVILAGCNAQSVGTHDHPHVGSSEKTLLAPISLTVGEGFTNPIGYYEADPKFSWKLPAAASGDVQSAYQIQVASSLPNLLATPDLWDSSKTVSRETPWITYEGEPLNSRQQIFWRVRHWDEEDRGSDWSEPQSLELGLLSNQDWMAEWIGHPLTVLSKNPEQATLATPQYLRKEFELPDEVLSARLYITAKGVFKPYINGQPVSEVDVMTPGWTPYGSRIETLTYDVSGLLQKGDNTIAASLAGGWYAGRVHNFHDRDHRLPARLLAQLEVTYADGGVETISTDDSWSSSLDGPIRFASVYDGEIYDQSYEFPGWNDNGYDDTGWSPSVRERIEQGVLLQPKQHAPVRTIKTLPAKDIISSADGVTIYDFGQNMVGVPKLKLPARKGQEIVIRYAEALHKGEFYTDNYRSAQSINRIIPDRDGEILYQPTFTYHGYRYIEISGYDVTQDPQLEWASALVQHSDIDIHANFHSSSPKLNQLSDNIVWGLRSNFFDIPLDCPQRDERLGWTGDAQVFVTPSLYIADSYGFWSAWLRSVREEQGEDGKIPLYVPFVDWLNFASSGWGDAATIIPWELYVATGDVSVLSENYDMMMAWVGYHQSNSEAFISQMNSFGDWLQPFPENLRGEQNGNRGDTDLNLIGTAYFARSVELTQKAAGVLGHDEDVARLNALHAEIKTAFNQNFFDRELNLKSGEPTQTTYLLGIAYDLFPQETRQLAIEKLVSEVEAADNHLRTGFLGTPLLPQVLQDVGRSDLMYEILFKETYPSWFFSINNGATTTWERWNSYTIEDGFNPEGMNSLNHYAYGTVARWFYEGILGIKPAEPGFKRVRIEPQFGDQLDHANGGYNTPQGLVSVEWARTDNSITLNVVVPKNTLADIHLPQLDEESLRLDNVSVRADALKGLKPGEYRLVGALTSPK